MKEEKQNKKEIGPKYEPHDEDVTVFGVTNFRNQQRKFGIKRRDRRNHMYLIGKTGVGKSTTMENMIVADIQRGEGVAVVDPHGDLAEKVLQFIPSWRVNDVVYFNPADLNYPVAFNPLESVGEAQKHLVASGVVGVYKKLFAESWGPRLEYLLRNAILALLEYPGSTLLGIMRILVDKSYRNKVIAKIKDPVVKSFWVEEYSRYPDRFQAEAISPIQNKVGQFLSNFLIRNIVGQVKSTIDMRDIMDNRKILIMNLAKGRIGEDTSALLGAMLITKIQIAAMERIDTPEKTRQDFYLYVDEFQNFATESFATILSEARKYRLNLIIAHQYIEQLGEQVRPAVFGNVGTIMCFRVGPSDAEELVTEFSPTFTEEDLVNLSKFDVYLRLMIDGVASDPFSATTLPPLSEEQKTGNTEKVIKVSRERYATDRNTIEEKIFRWSGMVVEDEKGEIAPALGSSGFMTAVKRDVLGSKVKKPKEPAASLQLFDAICDLCSKTTQVSFKPDGLRPVYCKDCLKKVREEKKNGVKIVPALSLKEAVSRPPVAFSKKSESVKEVVKIEPPEIILPTKPKTEVRPPEVPNYKAKQIKSGQVIKFDK